MSSYFILVSEFHFYTSAHPFFKDGFLRRLVSSVAKQIVCISSKIHNCAKVPSVNLLPSPTPSPIMFVDSISVPKLLKMVSIGNSFPFQNRSSKCDQHLSCHLRPQIKSPWLASAQRPRTASNGNPRRCWRTPPWRPATAPPQRHGGLGGASLVPAVRSWDLLSSTIASSCIQQKVVMFSHQFLGVGGAYRWHCWLICSWALPRLTWAVSMRRCSCCFVVAPWERPIVPNWGTHLKPQIPKKEHGTVDFECKMVDRMANSWIQLLNAFEFASAADVFV